MTHVEGMLSLGHNLIAGTVIKYWDDATYSPIYMVYYADLAGLVMAFVSAAYVVCHTVEAGIDFANGDYHQYAGWSPVANSIGYMELGIVLLWDLWALVVVVVAVYSAMELWNAVDARLAEAAAGSQGVETPLSTGKAIKAVTLTLLAGLTVMISGWSLG